MIPGEDQLLGLIPRRFCLYMSLSNLLDSTEKEGFKAVDTL